MTGRQGDKKEKMEIQKFKYLGNENSFFGEIKTFFIVFEGLSFDEKQNIDKKQRTQALTFQNLHQYAKNRLSSSIH